MNHGRFGSFLMFGAHRMGPRYPESCRIGQDRKRPARGWDASSPSRLDHRGIVQQKRIRLPATIRF